MAEHEDYVMRPALRHLCSYESLINGSLDLIDVAIMNEALDVQAANEESARKWAAQHKG